MIKELNLGLMYRRKTYDMKTVREVHNYYPANYGAPGKKRDKRRNLTPEEMDHQNMLQRVRKLKRLILMNFRPGDYHMVLNYRPEDRPEDFKEAKKDLKAFLDRMRKAYKKQGEEFKYIAITERGKRGQILHHHLIIEDLENLNTAKLVKEMWPHGNIYLSDLYEDGQYEKLAEYIVKKETKDPEGWSSYTRSRNLKTPGESTETMKRRNWPQEPRPPKGWYIVKDSIRNGFNPVTGYPYQYYFMVKEEGIGGNNIRGHDTEGPPKRSGPVRIRD